jgi:hypothetical protein
MSFERRLSLLNSIELQNSCKLEFDQFAQLSKTCKRKTDTCGFCFSDWLSFQILFYTSRTHSAQAETVGECNTVNRMMMMMMMITTMNLYIDPDITVKVIKFNAEKETGLNQKYSQHDS